MDDRFDSRRPETKSRCYRIRLKYLVVGVFGAICFGGWGIASTAMAYWNVDGSFRRPEIFALVNGAFWLGLTLLSVWLIAAWRRERLSFDGDSICQQRIFLSSTFRFADVNHIRWYGWPAGGSVVLRTHSAQKITIYLDNFRCGEREEIVRCLRDDFAEEIQQNWTRFKESPCVIDRPARQASRTETIIWIVVVAVIFLGFAGAFIYCWLIGLSVLYLLIGVANVAGAIFLLLGLRNLPPKDRGDNPPSANGESPAFPAASR